MGRALNPNPGVTDQLGTNEKPWAKIIAQVIQDENGDLFLREGFDASLIGGGLLNPSIISALLPSTLLGGSSSVTFGIGSPGVVNWPNNGLFVGCPIIFSTNGTLPTPLVAGTVYYVSNVIQNAFNIALTPGGANINFGGLPSGVTTCSCPTLASLLSQAFAGGGDPVARINTGSSLISGAKIAPSTLSPDAINPLLALNQIVQIGSTGATNPNVTLTIASPGVVNWSAHGLVVGQPVVFANSGGNLPTGLVPGTIYYVVNPTTNAFNVAQQLNGAAIAFSGSQSGTQSVTATGVIQSIDYDPTIPKGFILSQTQCAFYTGSTNQAQIFTGVLQGSIQIGNFLADNNPSGANGLSIVDPNVASSGWHVDQQGRMWMGSDTYGGAPVQFDQYGNFYLNSTATSLSRIDAGAIDITVGAVQSSPSGGQYAGQVTLTPLTRGADIYYTEDGSDPTNAANVGRTLYQGPFTITPSGSLTIKAVAFKLGKYGPVSTWIYTTSPNTVAAPIFNPIPGFYTTNASTFPVSLSSNTPGATIKYTIDGSDPGPANGTIYTTPILLGHPITNLQIRAYAIKAGLTDSSIVSGFYTIKKGGGQGGGGGNFSG